MTFSFCSHRFAPQKWKFSWLDCRTRSGRSSVGSGPAWRKGGSFVALMGWKWLELRLNDENDSGIRTPRNPLTSVHYDSVARIMDSGGIICKWNCTSRAAMEETSSSVASLFSYLVNIFCEKSSCLIFLSTTCWLPVLPMLYVFCAPKSLILNLLFTGRNSHRLSS